MHTIYKYVAYLIALLVVVQSAVVVWGMAAEIRFRINNPDAGAADVPFPLGAQLHGMIGMYVIPIAALVLVVLGLAMRDGRRWALWVLVASVVQVALGIGGIVVSEYLGLVHGIVAFVLLACALLAARHAGRHEHADPAQHHHTAAPVG